MDAYLFKNYIKRLLVNNIIVLKSKKLMLKTMIDKIKL